MTKHNNISRFSINKKINCNSVVINIESDEIANLPYLEINSENTITYKMDNKDIIYGLGENTRGINKRGWIYESYCTDEFSHSSDKKSLYGAHNFIMINGIEKFGVFIDSPGRVIFDIGYTSSNILEIKIPGGDFDIYIIKGEAISEISKEFRKLIGENYVPPKWAFGYQQSRWSYKNKKEVLEVFNEFKNRDIPIDCIYLDIDYMENFKNFTIDRKAFPDFEEMVKEFKIKGVRLIPIIDAGVKIEKGYDVCEEGVEKGYYCLDKNGKEFVAAVWPGKVHFPDFLNSDVRKWFGEKYKFLTDKGIEGFWNDMNEPAIFYSEEGLKEAYKIVEESKNKNLDIYSYFNLKDSFQNLSNSSKDYNSFYHNVNGQLVNHNDVHNLYGYNMTRSASEGLKNIENNKRFLLFSRASMIGMHRYGGIWTGDNNSSWESLELNIKMMMNLNLCGFLYTGADTGGFGGNVTEDLAIRWHQFSVFTPLFRNHSALGTRKQEPYAFNKNTENILKSVIKFRYSLIPYLYSEYMKATKNYDLLFKTLNFEYNDELVSSIEDQLIVGDSIMVAPIYKQNNYGRYIYLPEKMAMLKVESIDNIKIEIMEKGHHYIDIPIEIFPIFIKLNKILPLAKEANNVENINSESLKLIAFVNDIAEYEYYDDDGATNNYKEGKFNTLKIKIVKQSDDFDICINKIGDIKIKELEVLIIDNNGNEKIKTLKL
ncbi:glycoside hydrolase family 31 protein [Clostridium carnis]